MSDERPETKLRDDVNRLAAIPYASFDYGPVCLPTYDELLYRVRRRKKTETAIDWSWAEWI